MKLTNCLWLVITMSIYSNVAAEDIKSLTSTCSACHGSDGISSNSQWPNLAGQQVDYLVMQMKAYRDGTRQDAVMTPQLLQDFNDKQLVEIANYFSALTPKSSSNANVNMAGKNVRARCVSCHGMSGNTVTSVWPNLANQQEAYLKKQLMDYKSGQRVHPVMQVIANELTDQEIADVAQYYSQQ